MTIAMDAFLAGIAVHLPERVVSNADLQAENPDWDMERIGAKVGIECRHLAGSDECASDLAYAAATRLLNEMSIDRSQIDYLLLCTQSPDYFLPTTACVLQHRLGLRTACGALDFNLGCSGYVYGLQLAKSLVATGMATNVCLLTAETYSKFIHPRDRTVRVVFGDAATASLVTSEPGGARIGAFTVGTDGSGAQNLIVPAGGCRTPRSEATRTAAVYEQGLERSAENLFMDGQELFLFTLQRIPALVNDTLIRSGYASVGDIDWFVLHQANAFMNERLRAKMGIPKEKAPLCMERYGNTVSNTIPIALRDLGRQVVSGHRLMLAGFGVGYSWAACTLEWGQVHLS